MPLRVVFFGTPDFAVPSLERILMEGHTVLAAVTQPDKPTGRGRKLTAPPVKVLATERGIPVLQPTSVRTAEFAAELRALNADVAVVVAYGKILPKAVLDAPRHGCLNVHASLLPAYRGAAPIQWAIVNGEKLSGVSIMLLDEGMDTGPVITRHEVPVLEDDDAISLAHMLAYQGAETMAETLATLEREGSLDATPQNDADATMAPMIRKEDARIRWSQKPERIICAVRGFLQWPTAHTRQGDKDLKILGVEGCSPDWVADTAFDARIATGTVVDVLKGRGFVVRTGGERGIVLVTRVKPEGKGEMGAFDYMNGGGIKIGEVLGKE